ncbi:putative S-adenosyl-L-methionine-dependent methyltransferase-domain-containing protein [Dendryphion nanum]|uniref:Protein arginine methyltransferase NDUFAF7 n=1 Tax=Dendryphion nanum TaxID=256645 RepID=A0A9P9EK39_9PLEO|nr:putative S-adenosyl-L-methionine-dependent methyltransferase-domain-containing protein [Dendryphion nanum]
MRSHTVRALRNLARFPRAYPIECRSAQYGIRWSSSSPSTGRQWSTPLAKSLAQVITTTGPVSVAAYMRQCLTSPDGGYYTRQTAGHDQFGAKGDFITSPEISQVFGELIGIWLYAEWLAQGRKSKGIQIIEVGPGRGTLMDDVLRTLSNFKHFASSVESIYLIEASPHLRTQQAKLLSDTTDLKETDLGWTAPCKYLPDCNIVWCEDIRFIPKDETKSPFILAHEFFDALPIHIFQNVASSSIPASSTIMTPTGPIKPKTGPQAPANQWHELVVSPVSPYEPSSTSTTTTSDSTNSSPQKEEVDFHLTISKSPTPHSLYLPQTSPRYKALSKTPDAIIEISPESLAYITDFATRIGGSEPTPTPSASPSPSPDQTTPNTTPVSTPTPSFQKPTPSGAALILDYGPATTIPANTLRGIRSHRPVSPFTSPGLVDISADVDFLALAESALAASPGVEVHGPVEQAFFLGTMGIAERVERLVQGREGDEELVRRVRGAWKRLVDRGPTGMGRIYKVMAIVPYGGEGKVRRPVGFGGDVVG